MVTESAQMMASALRRHGATDEQMPLTKAGRPYLGGYKNHPCTIWAGDNRANFNWLARHAQALLTEYNKRFGKVHACHNPIYQMLCMSEMIPEGDLTPFALAMPDDFRPHLNEHIGAPFDVVPNDDFTFISHASGDDAVQAYRRYYHSKADSKGGVHYRHTNPPDWWEIPEVIGV
tara:strand:- start:26691 stop:27215 length:525 start_codon:yes stop_codon:yes gene_type:complete